MRVFLRKLLHRIVLVEAWLLSLLYPRHQRDDGRRVAVLEPCPTSFGSAGDEALIAGVCRFAQQRASTGQVFVVSFHFPYFGILPKGTAHGGCLHRGGNPLFRLLSYLEWPLLLRKFDSFYIIGADLIDGYYSSSVSCFLFFLAHLASSLGVDVHIVSASFNDSPPDEVKRGLAILPPSIRFHLRDQYSAKRLEAVLHRPVSHSADVAFGLVPEPSPYVNSILNWGEQQRKLSRHLLILNINMLPIGKQYCERQEEYVEKWTEWLVAMVREKCSIIFISHDYRGSWGDHIAAELAFRQIPETVKVHCLLPSNLLHAAEIKAIAKSADLVVTGRMHLAIGALGCGTPVVGYAYQSKFEGIFDLFDQKGMVRAIEGIFANTAVEVQFCLHALSVSDETRRVIVAHADEVLCLASQNVTV